MTKNGGERLTKNGLNLKLNIKAAVRVGKRPGLLGEAKSALVPSLNREDNESLPGPLTVNDHSNEKQAKSEKARNLFLLKSFLTSKHRKNTEDTADKSGQDADANDSSGRVHRSSIICSTGTDKYSYDSENIQLPLRPIDFYEKQLSIQSNASSTGSSSRSKMFSSATEDNSDREASLSPVCERLKFDPMESSSPLDQLHSPRFHQHYHDHDHNEQHQHRHRHKNQQHQFYVHRQSPTPTPTPSPSPSPAFNSSNDGDSIPPPNEIKYKRSSIVGSSQQNVPDKSVQINGSKSQNSWSRFKLTNILKFGGSKDKRNVQNKTKGNFNPKIINKHSP